MYHIVDYHLVCIYTEYRQVWFISLSFLCQSCQFLLHLGSKMNSRPRIKPYARTNAIIIQIEIHISKLWL